MSENGKPITASNRGWQMVLGALTYLPRRAGMVEK